MCFFFGSPTGNILSLFLSNWLDALTKESRLMRVMISKEKRTQSQTQSHDYWEKENRMEFSRFRVIAKLPYCWPNSSPKFYCSFCVNSNFFETQRLIICRPGIKTTWLFIVSLVNWNQISNLKFFFPKIFCARFSGPNDFFSVDFYKFKSVYELWENKNEWPVVAFHSNFTSIKINSSSQKNLFSCYSLCWGFNQNPEMTS